MKNLKKDFTKPRITINEMVLNTKILAGSTPDGFVENMQVGGDGEVMDDGLFNSKQKNKRALKIWKEKSI